MRLHLRTSRTGPDRDIQHYHNSKHRVQTVYSTEQPTSEFVYGWRTMLFPHATTLGYNDLLIVDSSTKHVANPGEMDVQIVSFAWDFTLAAARQLLEVHPEGGEIDPEAPEALAVYARGQLQTAIAHKSHYRSNRAIAWEEWYSWTHSQRFARTRCQTNPGLAVPSTVSSTPWRKIANWDSVDLRSTALQKLTAETQELQRTLNSDIFE